MGNNTSSNPESGSRDSKLKRDSSVISKPKVLGTGRNTSISVPSSKKLSDLELSKDSPGPPVVVQATTASDTNPFRRRSLNSRQSSGSAQPPESGGLNVAAPGRVSVQRSRSANPPTVRETPGRLSVPPSYSEAIASTPYLPQVPPPQRSAPNSHHASLDVPFLPQVHRRAHSHSSFGHLNRHEAAVAARMIASRSRIDAAHLSPGHRTRPFASDNDLPAGSRHARVTVTTSPVDIPATSPQSSTSLVTPTNRPTPQRRSTKENALELLKKYNTVIIVDDSSSMGEGKLWAELREALAPLAEMATKYDVDGIDVCFLNNPVIGRNMRNAAAVRRLFDSVRPRGVTPTGAKLEELLNAYMLDLERAKKEQDDGRKDALKECKPVNYIVMTDGAPTDDPEPVIVQVAKRLDAGHFPITQVGIQFVQIGSDPDAADALRELDDGLASTHGIRDIVDTTPYAGGPLNAEIITKILLGGVNRRVDKKGARSVM